MINQTKVLKRADVAASASAEARDDARRRYTSKLEELLRETLEAPTAFGDEVSRLLSDLENLETESPQPSIQEAKQALESARGDSRLHRCNQLAQDTAEVAAKLGLRLVVDHGSSSANAAKRPRLTTSRRAKLAEQLLELLRTQQPKGLSKAQIAHELGVTSNQIKRLLQAPNLKGRVSRIGHASKCRYVLNNTSNNDPMGDK